jgi:(2Fe-2S) ferredoxin
MPADSTHPLATKRLVIGHLTVCQGCCCGNTENGRPPVPVDWLKKEWRARGLLKRVQLTISGCLGPCDLPNVVTISNESGTQWFGEITEFEQYRDLVDWATRSRDAGELNPDKTRPGSNWGPKFGLFASRSGILIPIRAIASMGLRIRHSSS